MANRKNWWGMLAVVLAFGLVLSGCASLFGGGVPKPNKKFMDSSKAVGEHAVLYVDTDIRGISEFFGMVVINSRKGISVDGNASGSVSANDDYLLLLPPGEHTIQGGYWVPGTRGYDAFHEYDLKPTATQKTQKFTATRDSDRNVSGDLFNIVLNFESGHFYYLYPNTELGEYILVDETEPSSAYSSGGTQQSRAEQQEKIKKKLGL